MYKNEKTEEFGWMNKIAQKMLQHKKGIVALFAVLAVLCALLSRRVKAVSYTHLVTVRPVSNRTPFVSK